ncbi:MAG: AAA family ATPase [Phycisphaerales bacterium]|nr:AAA family ATPase [Phycisphaerales bacterium]
MLKSISITGFKCFDRFAIDDLAQVNLIGGENNVGKSALLEAIFLLISGANVGNVLKINAFRGITEIRGGELDHLREQVWSHLFSGFDAHRKIQLAAVEDSGELKTTYDVHSTGRPVRKVDATGSGETRPNGGFRRGDALRVEFTPTKGKKSEAHLVLSPEGIRTESTEPQVPLRGVFVTSRHRDSASDVERFGRLQLSHERFELMEALRIVEPRLTDVATIVSGGVPMIYGDIGLGRKLPLSLMGEGVSRLCATVLAIADSRDGCALIDEIENGLHYSVLRRVWEVLRRACQTFNVQLFATTHSRECAAAAHEVFSETSDYNFAYCRLDRVNGEINVKTFDRETLDTALRCNLETR